MAFGDKFAKVTKSLLAIPIVNFPPNMITIMVLRGMESKGIHLPINPESLMGLRRYLVTVTNTLEGGWVDDFGPAPSPFTLRGTFGYRQKTSIDGKVKLSGFGWIKYLEHIVDESHVSDNDGNLPEVWLLSWISQHFYTVVLEDLNMSQTVSRNMIWQYTLRITALKPIGEEYPAGDAILSFITLNLKPTSGAMGSYLKEIPRMALGNL